MKELLDIYMIFFKMGAVTFGGGYAMLPILRREIVQRRQWLSEEQIMDYYAVSQGLPGIIAINVSVFIGFRQRKISGAIVAALGMVTPSILIITLIAALLSNYQDNPYIRHALNAVSICVCALIADAVISLWKKGVKDSFGVLLFLTVALLSVFTEVSPILLIPLAAASGIIAKRAREERKA